jgi:hypothetical protein
MLNLIKNADIYSPEPIGMGYLLLIGQAGDLLVLLALMQRAEALSMVHKFPGDGSDGCG